MVHVSEQELLVNLIKFSWERNDVSPPNNCYCPVILSSPCSFLVQRKPSHLQLWWLQFWYRWFCCWTWIQLWTSLWTQVFPSAIRSMMWWKIDYWFLCKFYIAHLHLFTIFIFNYEVPEVCFLYVKSGLDYLSWKNRLIEFLGFTKYLGSNKSNWTPKDLTQSISLAQLNFYFTKKM